MRPAALFPLPAVLLLSSAPALGDASDLHRVNAEVRGRGLPGVWRVVRWQTATAKVWAGADFTLEFGDGQMVDRRGKAVTKTACELDDSQDPRWMTLDRSDAIYRIRGDTLTICAGPRGGQPKAFRAGGPDGGRTLLTLTRVRRP
jgi:uncharacterized protein (TIGR03067 family)